MSPLGDTFHPLPPSRERLRAHQGNNCGLTVPYTRRMGSTLCGHANLCVLVMADVSFWQSLPGHSPSRVESLHQSFYQMCAGPDFDLWTCRIQSWQFAPMCTRAFDEAAGLRWLTKALAHTANRGPCCGAVPPRQPNARRGAAAHPGSLQHLGAPPLLPVSLRSSQSPPPAREAALPVPSALE